MIKMLRELNQVDINIVVEKIFQSVVEYSGGLEFLDDDLTFVLMEYNPK